MKLSFRECSGLAARFGAVAVLAAPLAFASVAACTYNVTVTMPDDAGVGTGATSNTNGAGGHGTTGAGSDGDGGTSTSGGNGGTGGGANGNGAGDGGAGGSGGSGGSGGDGGTSSSGSPFPAGQGMTMPWVEMQAETAATNATVLPPSRTKWDATQIQAEAIGRQAVQLNKTGDYVEFTTTAPANSIVVRYSIPDAPTGGGINATLGLYVNGTRVKSMNLTSHYSWSYNGEYIPSVSTDTAGVASLNDPTKPYPHTFFDEYNSGPGDGPENLPLIGEIPVGAKVRIQRDAQDTAGFYVIDLVDFEEVPAAIAMPAGFTSITDPSLGVNIQPNDGIDHADDLEKVLLSGAKKLYFPPGEYIIRKYQQYSQNAALDNQGSEIAGAGIWYTRFLGKQAIFFCDVGGSQCNLHDFAIFGDSTARDEPVNGPQKAIAGYQGNGTQLYDLWIEHEVAGMWIGNDPDNQKSGPTQNLHIHDVRIRDTYADGINLDNGTFGSLVENCHMRNTGDDAATAWAVNWPLCVQSGQCAPPANDPGEANDPGQGVGNGNTFNHISVQMPWRANCFAAYGGYNNTWENSTCEDVLTYPGLFVDNEFGSYPFGAENTPAPANPYVTTFNNISLLRAGGEMFYEPNSTSCPSSNASCSGLTPWYHGAIKLYMRQGDVNDVLISNITVTDPTYAGIELRGFDSAIAQQYGIAPPQSFLTAADNAKFSNITLQNITVTGAGTNGILVQDLETGPRGSVNFDGVVVSGSAQTALNLMGGSPASLVNKVGSNNSGW